MLTISSHSAKGGVGKTTSLCALAHVWGTRGVRVLVVDADPQAHATISLGTPRDAIDPVRSTHAVLTGQTDAAAAVQPSGVAGVDLIPGHASLATVDVVLAGEYGRELRLRDALAGLADRYDVALVDLGAARGLLWANAMVASDYLLVPTHVDTAAVDGAVQIVTAAGQLATVMRRALPVLAVIPTDVRRVGRTRESRAVETAMRSHFGELVTEAVPHAPRAADAFGYRRTLIGHAPDSPAATAYVRIAEHLADKLALPLHTVATV